MPDSAGRRIEVLSRTWDPAGGMQIIYKHKWNGTISFVKTLAHCSAICKNKDSTCILCGIELNWALQCWLSPRASSWALGYSAQERESGEVKRRRVFRLQSAGYSVQMGGAMEAGAMASGLWTEKQERTPLIHTWTTENISVYIHTEMS